MGLKKEKDNTGAEKKRKKDGAEDRKKEKETVREKMGEKEKWVYRKINRMRLRRKIWKKWDEIKRSWYGERDWEKKRETKREREG